MCLDTENIMGVRQHFLHSLNSGRKIFIIITLIGTVAIDEVSSLTAYHMINSRKT